MTRAETRTWYRVALANPANLVASSGEHMGQAIAEAEAHAPGSYAVAVDHAGGNDIPLGESVGKGHVVELGASEIPAFAWPVGVLPSLAGARPGARRGWTVRPQQKLLVMEAQTDRAHLTDLFLGMIERLPSADNLEIRVQDHFESAGQADVWITSRINAKKILRFLDDHDVELLGNGHLELNVYVREHRATLRLTEHKTIVWLADERALETDVTRWFTELSVPRVDELVTVSDMPHFHYRPSKSRDRKHLAEELYRQRLRRVKLNQPAREKD